MFNSWIDKKINYIKKNYYVIKIMNNSIKKSLWKTRKKQQALLNFSGFLATKCISLNHKTCLARPIWQT